MVPNPNYVYSEVDLALDLDKKSGPHTANMKHCFFSQPGFGSPLGVIGATDPFFGGAKISGR